MRRALSFGVLLVAVSVATVCEYEEASAAPPTDDELGRVFGEGLARFDADDPRGAIELWAPLVEREPERAWRALYNLGLAHEAIGDAARAVDAYDRFVRRVGQLPGAVPPQIEERRQDAVDRATALKASLGVLRVVVDAPIPGAVISLDGAPHQALPLEAYLAPGPHEVVAISGAQRHRYDANVERGVSVEVVVLGSDLAPPARRGAPDVKPPPPPQRPILLDTPTFPTAWVIAGGALTAVSFAIPIALGVDAWNEANAAAALGRGHTGYADALDAYEGARTRYYATYAVPAVLGAATIAVAIGGAVSVALGPKTGAPEVGVAFTGEELRLSLRH